MQAVAHTAQYGRKTQGAFHLTKNFGNFSHIANGKGRFGPFRPDYSGPPLEVDHFDRLDRSDWNLPFHFHKLVTCLTSVNRRVTLRNGTQNGKDHFARFPRFNRKRSFHFALVYLGCSDCENGKHPVTVSCTIHGRPLNMQHVNNVTL